MCDSIVLLLQLVNGVLTHSTRKCITTVKVRDDKNMYIHLTNLQGIKRMLLYKYNTDVIGPKCIRRFRQQYEVNNTNTLLQ